ncbi:MAG TPA: 1,4-dihydroxy-6-naphthoate synthase, partial [Trueperaceae bacterium]|nr:1,4-dihydroxy-6-naphthoate synthase [Trueperaceae bacterium]
MSTRLSLGYSPCPNDTFIFHALTHGLVAGADDLEFDVALDDVEAMNRATAGGLLDVAKVSYHAYGYIASDYVLLRSGGALGRGVGPLLVAPTPELDLRGKRVAVPGGRTTAKLLLELWRPEGLELTELRYDAIMPAVVAGEVDAGLI